MVISIWGYKRSGNCKVNWYQIGPTSVRLINSTSYLDIIYHNTNIPCHITQWPLTDKRFSFSMNISTTREPSLVICWIQWVCQFSLWCSSLLNVWFRSNSDLSQWSSMANIWRDDFPTSFLIFTQVLDLALTSTFYLICEVVKMCHSLINSIKNCAAYRIVEPQLLEYLKSQRRRYSITNTFIDVVIFHNKSNPNGRIIPIIICTRFLFLSLKCWMFQWISMEVI